MLGCIWKNKEKLTSDLFLNNYNPDSDIIAASDASSYGVGACILHKMTDVAIKPIAHVLRALLHAEKNYLQIEKEALGHFCSLKVSPFYSWSTLYATDWPQSITHYFGHKERSAYSHSQHCRDGVQSCLIIASKWCNYHRINSVMRTDYQG